MEEKPKYSISTCKEDATRELDLDKRKDEHQWHHYCSKHKPVGPVTGERDIQLSFSKQNPEEADNQ